jgi:hypothetical protein
VRAGSLARETEKAPLEQFNGSLKSIKH